MYNLLRLVLMVDAMDGFVGVLVLFLEVKTPHSPSVSMT